MHALLIFGSSRGGTAGLARMIAEALADRGVDVELAAGSELPKTTDLNPFDAVIVGGAIYHDRWHADAAHFVTANLSALQTKPVWFFSSGPLDDSARSGALAPVPQVRELARRADVRGHVTFGGVLDRSSLGIFRSLFAWGKPGDYRDPEHVAEWVETITAWLTASLRPTPPPTSADDRDRRRLRRSRLLRRRRPAPVDPVDPVDNGDDGDNGDDDDLGLDVLVDDES